MYVQNTYRYSLPHGSHLVHHQAECTRPPSPVYEVLVVHSSFKIQNTRRAGIYIYTPSIDYVYPRKKCSCAGRLQQYSCTRISTRSIALGLGLGSFCTLTLVRTCCSVDRGTRRHTCCTTRRNTEHCSSSCCCFARAYL